VRDEDEALASFTTGARQQRSDLACIIVVEIAGRLVSENDRRFVGEGSGNSNTLLLTAAQFGGPVTASIAEANGVEELHCAPTIQSTPREHWQKDVFERRKLREQVV
jgi:hypothetical protein